MKETQEQVNEYWKKDIWFYLREKGDEMFKFLASLIPLSCKYVLDAGCGEALILKHLPKDVCYTGFDLSDYIIDKNWKTYEERTAEGKAIFEVDDIFSPKESDFYDCVLLLSVFASLSPSEILNLLKTTKNKFHPKIIIASSIEEHLTPVIVSEIRKEFKIMQEIHKTFSLIDKPVGVGTPEQLNYRVILLLEC